MESPTSAELQKLCQELTGHPAAQDAWIALQQFETEGHRIARYALELAEKEALVEEARVRLRDRLKALLDPPPRA